MCVHACVRRCVCVICVCVCACVRMYERECACMCGCVRECDKAIHTEIGRVRLRAVAIFAARDKLRKY